MAIPNMWRTKKQRYSLQGEICPSCTSAIFPPRSLCPQCGSPMDATQSHRHQVDSKNANFEPTKTADVVIVGTAFAASPAPISNPAGDD